MLSSPQDSARAELIGTFIEILGFGIYLVVLTKCIQVLHVRHTEGRPAAIMACTALTIFMLVTTHFIMDILRSLNAFTSHMEIANYAVVYYTIVRRDLDLLKSAAYVAMTIVSDSLIGFRTFVVWGRNPFLASFLIFLLFADVALGTYAVYLLGLTEPGQNALAGRVTDRVKWFYAITLVYNVLCTTLIATKIWRVQREVDRYSPAVSALHPKRLRAGSRLMMVVVESAAIYSLFLLLLIVMSVVGAPGMLAMLDLIAPMIGIVFSMVIIRVSVDRTRWDSLKISTHLNFGITMSSSVHTHTVGSVTGQRRGSRPHILGQEEECYIKAGGFDATEGDVALGKLGGGDGDLGLGRSLEDLSFATVAVSVCAHGHASRQQSSRSKRTMRSKFVTAGLDDSGFHSAYEDDLEGGDSPHRCGFGEDEKSVAARRGRATPEITVSLPAPLPAALQTPTDGESLPLSLPLPYMHSHHHPYAYRATRRDGEGGEPHVVSMGMFSASRSSVHLPLPGL